jgi:hypothetical protein
VNSMPTVVYDLRANPITFDFCAFLASTSIIFKSQSQSAFDLAIIATGFRNVTPREKSYGIQERLWRLDNLISPVAKACSFVRNLSVIRSTPTGDGFFLADSYPQGFRLDMPLPSNYSPRLVIDVYKKTGIAPFVFKPTVFASAAMSERFSHTKDDLVTLSPRLASYDRSRNSELSEWFNLYRLLIKSGYRVLILPDLDDALGSRILWEFQWPVLEAAAFSLDVRLAAMQVAKLNVISAGGLGAVATYSKTAYLICNVLHESNHVANLGYFREFVGLEVGGQYPWVTDDQRLDWGSFEADRIFGQYIDGK